MTGLWNRARRRKNSIDKPSADYARHKDYVAEKSRQRYATGADIGDIPEPKNPQRRERCEADFALWSATYCQPRHKFADSSNHEKLKDALQGAFESRDSWFAFEAPRGEAKTTLFNECSAWALSKGMKRFIMMFASSGANVSSSRESLDAIFTKLPLVQEDYPEICYPLMKKLERVKQSRLTYHGDLLKIRWGDYDQGKIIFTFPNIPGSPSNGSRILMQAIGSRFRGVQFTNENGTPIRPDLAYFDDIQDPAIAANPDRVRKNLEKMTVDAAGLSGDDPMPIINSGTPFHDDCLMSQTIRDRRFTSMILKSIYQYPDRMDLWEQYLKVWEAEFDAGVEKYGIFDKKRASDEAYLAASAFYQSNRNEMDAGMNMSWPARYAVKYSGASAIENIMREYLIILGPEAFEQEKNCQTRPLIDTKIELVTDETFTNKVDHSLKRFVSPNESDFICAAVDVHETILYYELTAFAQGFDAHIIDYGTWPEQKGRTWSVENPQTSLANMYPTKGKSGELYQGLTDLVWYMANRKYYREDGTEIYLKKILIDNNNGIFQPTVRKFADEHENRDKICLYLGNYYSSGTQIKKKGERGGLEWKWTGAGKKTVVAFRDFWKSYNLDRWLTPRGELACKTIFSGGITSTHKRFYSELVAQIPQMQTLKSGQQMLRWPLNCDHPDHWGDCDFMTTLCASICDITQKTEKRKNKIVITDIDEEPVERSVSSRRHDLRRKGFII